ncbi:calcium channel flower isoform X2 [Oratosquilla oratoria]|uniref:calcium channel flower isoform X2 n=1 Tax=Oratosquilla oratoria TaxID=337810 RepID=UPI003F75F1E1
MSLFSPSNPRSPSTDLLSAVRRAGYTYGSSKVFDFVTVASSRGNMSAAPQQNDVPWWLRYAGRGVGTAGGLLAMILGVVTTITIYPICIVAGIWQVIAGFIVVSAEAPFCCMFVDFVQQYSKWVEERPHWQKAVLYVVMSLPAVILCPGLSTVFGSGLIFITGVLYGMMALGRKASRDDMIAAAQNSTRPGNMKDVLVDSEAQVPS